MRAKNGAALAALMVIGASVPAGARPSAAQATPSVVVTPDVIHDGDWVHIEVSGFPDGHTAAVICEAAAATGPSDPGQCGVLAGLAEPGGTPASTDVPVYSRFQAYDGSGERDCATIPGGCVVGVVTATDTTGTTLLAKVLVPITFVPELRGDDRQNLADGDTVHLTGRFFPPGDYTAAQCDRAYLDDPTPAQRAARCGPATPVTSTPGELAVDVVVHDPLLPTGGGEVPCGLTGCVAVLAGPGTPVAASLGVSFGDTLVTVEPDTDLVSGRPVEVTVVGAPMFYEDRAVGEQCALPAGPTRMDSVCGQNGWGVPVDSDTGSGSGLVTVVADMNIGNYERVDCRAVPCGLVVFGRDGIAGQSAPIAFGPPPVTIEPNAGLLDGQPMTVRGEGLAAGYHVLARCNPSGCDQLAEVSIDESGQFTTTVPAAQRFSVGGIAPTYCRADCWLELYVYRLWWTVAVVPYAMAEGELAVAPDTGLEDGQEVVVTGSELMPTYAGPSLLGFATGGWALVQCDAGVLDEPSLYGVFTHCSGANARAVDVPTSTLDTTFPVAATITRILGGTTDCRVAACVAGLVRFEQDASLSHHLVPVAFD